MKWRHVNAFFLACCPLTLSESARGVSGRVCVVSQCCGIRAAHIHRIEEKVVRYQVGDEVEYCCPLLSVAETGRWKGEEELTPF